MSFKILTRCASEARKQRNNINKRIKKQYHIFVIAKRADGTYTSAMNAPAKDKAPSLHAEYRALMKAGKGATIWIARILADNSWAMAKPCNDCMSIIRNMGVRKVYYTISSNEYGVIKL